MLSIALESTEPSRAGQDKGLVDVALLLRAAVESVGCPHQVAASAVGYQPDYWCRVLAGERGIVPERLGRLPRDVQVGLVTRWAEALGLRVERRSRETDGFAQLAGLLAEKRIKITLEHV